MFRFVRKSEQTVFVKKVAAGGGVFFGENEKIFLNGPIPASFLSQWKYNLKSVDDELGDRTWAVVGW